MRYGRVVVVCFGAAALLAGCRPATRKAPGPIRLVDLYRPEPGAATAAHAAPQAGAGSEWRFASTALAGPGPSSALPAPPAPPFAAGPGVSDLKVKDAHLIGRTASTIPIVHLRRPRSDD